MPSNLKKTLEQPTVQKTQKRRVGLKRLSLGDLPEISISKEDELSVFQVSPASLERCRQEELQASFAKNCQQVIPGLFLGRGFVAASEEGIKYLGSLGITHQLNTAAVKGRIGVESSDKLTVHEVKLDDKVDQHISDEQFAQAFKFINVARAKSEGVFVNCFMGRSRSATLVIAYLMHNPHLMADESITRPYATLKETFAFVASKREEISPNLGFIMLLEELEKKLREQYIADLREAALAAVKIDGNTARKAFEFSSNGKLPIIVDRSVIDSVMRPAMKQQTSTLRLCWHS